MRKSTRAIVFFFTIGLACALLVTTAQAEAPGRKIVVFQDWYVNDAAQARLLENFGSTLLKPLPLINAWVVLPPMAADRALGLLEQQPGVLRIDEDLLIAATKPGGGKPQPPPQPVEDVPWGVDRIDADSVWPTTTGSGVKVAILDTGIDMNHPDLQGNIKGGYNAINPRKSPEDDNGHGTHVAGTVAALDNEIGVIGVGPEIHLYAVKVLDRSGNGWLSDLVEGIDWCIFNDIQVINMSLGASADNQSFHDAITAAYNAGIVQVAAAGNNGGPAIDYPAKYPETIAVSAVDESDGFAGFSSYGPEVDLTAPGVHVLSTYKDDWYAWGSGTSMATPHVTGAAALVLEMFPAMGPDDVLSRLTSTAEDLGLLPEEQGAGLVDVESAVLSTP